MKYVCDLCGWVYDTEVGDPKRGVPAGTLPADISKYSGCPVCGADWLSFTKAGTPKNTLCPQKTPASQWQSMKYQDKHESER